MVSASQGFNAAGINELVGAVGIALGATCSTVPETSSMKVPSAPRPSSGCGFIGARMRKRRRPPSNDSTVSVPPAVSQARKATVGLCDSP